MTGKIRWVGGILLGVLLVACWLPFRMRECVNIYDWYGVLPRDVIDQFERETRIRVNYDVFENSEALEAKLLASNSGYDVVFPTVVPYAVRHLALGIYQKLNKAWLPNLAEVEPILIEKMQEIDEKFEYLLPYYWGTTGIAYDEERLEQILPGIPKDSYNLLFDEEIVRKLRPYGVSLLQEAVDVIPPFLGYSGKEWDSRSLEDLWFAAEKLARICQNVRRFSSSRFIMDLIMGDICVAQSWSGEALKAIEDAKDIGRKIRYIIPKEGADIWIDAIAIPVGAPNVRNAHIFINFLLRPDISARITNHSKVATMVLSAKKWIRAEILSNPLIFPSEEVLQRLHISPVFMGPKAEEYERVRTRVWAQLKMQRTMTEASYQKIICQQRERVSNYKTS